MNKLERLVVATFGAMMLMGTTAVYADRDDDDDTFRFEATLTGAQEEPAADTDAIGRVTVRFDKGLTKVDVRLRLRGVDSMVVAAHFHCNRPGLNGPVVFGILQPGPLSEIGDRAKVTLTNENFSGADCVPLVGRPVNNIAALNFAMRDGLIYFNVHTADFGPGEVRGQMIRDD